MKKLAISIGLTLTAASASVMANNVGHPNMPLKTISLFQLQAQQFLAL